MNTQRQKQQNRETDRSLLLPSIIIPLFSLTHNFTVIPYVLARGQPPSTLPFTVQQRHQDSYGHTTTRHAAGWATRSHMSTRRVQGIPPPYAAAQKLQTVKVSAPKEAFTNP